MQHTTADLDIALDLKTVAGQGTGMWLPGNMGYRAWWEIRSSSALHTWALHLISRLQLKGNVGGSRAAKTPQLLKRSRNSSVDEASHPVIIP